MTAPQPPTPAPNRSSTTSTPRRIRWRHPGPGPGPPTADTAPPSPFVPGPPGPASVVLHHVEPGLVTAGLTTLGLMGIAGAISYQHLLTLALQHGQHGWLGHAFPLSVDGVEMVASLRLLADQRIHVPSGWWPWAALVVGTGFSVFA